MNKTDKKAKKTVAEQVEVLLGQKKKTPLPNDILVDALDGYASAQLSSGALTIKLKKIEERIRSEVKDSDIAVHYIKSLSMGKESRAIGVYSVRPVSMGHATYFGAYFHSLVFKPDCCLFLSAVEPAGTTSHLHERIISRSQHPYSTFTEAQGRLSDFWPLFAEAGNRLRLAGKSASPIQYFASSWADGLLFGEMQYLPVEEGLGAPYVVEFKDGVGRQELLPDLYSQGDKRLLASFKTFIGPAELKPAQIEIRNKLDKFREKHADVVEKMKWRWRIGNPARHPISLEIARVLGCRDMDFGKLEEASAEMIDLVTSDIWLSEAEKNRENAERAKERAQNDPEPA